MQPSNNCFLLYVWCTTVWQTYVNNIMLIIILPVHHFFLFLCWSFSFLSRSFCFVFILLCIVYYYHFHYASVPSLLLLPQFTVCYLLSASVLFFNTQVRNKYALRLWCACARTPACKPKWMLLSNEGERQKQNSTQLRVARPNVIAPFLSHSSTYRAHCLKQASNIVSMVLVPLVVVTLVKVMILLRTHTSCILMWPKIAAIKRNFTTSAKSVIKPNKTGIAASVYH